MLDVTIIIIGIIYILCSILLNSNTRKMLFFCGIFFIVISVLPFSIKKIIEILMIAIIIIYHIFNILVYVVGINSNSPYAICVPGAQVIGKKVTETYGERLNLAFKMYKKYNENPLIITCGAIGDTAKITEAEAGANYLIERKVNREKIIKEQNSYNTFDSFKNVLQLLLKKDGRVLVTTSNWGMLRAYIVGKKAGLNIRVIGCKTSFLWFVNYCVRERFALIYNLIIRK